MKKIRFWLKNARPVSLPQSIFPAVLAAMMAFHSSGFSLLYSILAITGVVFLHLSMNLFDDYFDYKNHDVKIRNALAGNKTFSRVGKCSYLVSKEASLRELFFVATLFLLFATVLGGIIFLNRGIFILYLMLIGGILGITYSAKPFCLSYRGLGELTVGIMFGPLLMTGVFYASCGDYMPSVGIVSVSVGLLVVNILFTHSILDYHPDKYVRKKTLAVLIKSTKVQFIFSCFFTLSPFVLIVYGIVRDYLSVWYALVLFTFPLGLYLIYSIDAFFRYPQKQFTPCFLMGPMENWERRKQNGIAWFSFRWFLSRNLTMFFCLLAMIASILSF
ncbi:MAG: prenyltransferase [Bacteroidales bacterium]|nr:prenyltransferase [Bacteroidales bacterium]